MDDTPRPITEHLDELRKRLFWVLGAWAICAAIAGSQAKVVFELLMHPAVSAVTARGHTLIAVAPPELFFTYVKSAILAGFLASIPVTLYQIWTFIAPGLYPSERQFALPFVLATTTLFFAGCVFGYLIAVPFVFEYFLTLEADYVTTAWTTQNVFSFLSRLYVAFGLSFQLPIAIFFLTLAGIVRPETLASSRKYAFVIMFVAAAILTPPDVVSQIMLALPLMLLYEGGLLMSRIVIRRRDREAAQANNDATRSVQ